MVTIGPRASVLVTSEKQWIEVLIFVLKYGLWLQEECFPGCHINKNNIEQSH